MKNLLVAAILIATSAMSFGAPAQAAATITTYGRHYHAGPRCYTKSVKHYRNGRVWYEKTRVCR